MVRDWLRQFRRDMVLKVHGSGSSVTTTATKEMVDQPINPEWIDEGTPKARAFCAIRSADGSISSGEWECTAGRFHWTYFEDEMIRILEGEALIEVGGQFRSYGPGDSVFFPLGQTVRWNVPKYVRKVFFIRHPGKVVEVMRTFKVLGAFAVAALSQLAASEPFRLALTWG